MLNSYPKSKAIGRQNLYSHEVEEYVNQHLTHELNASYQYLSMANFLTTEQPWHGFAAMYYAKSGEKRSNAIHLMGYQIRRGGLTSIVDVRKPEGSWKNVEHSLEFAMEVEAKGSQFLHTFHGIAKAKLDSLTMNLIAGEFLGRTIRNFHFYKQLLTRLQVDGSAATIYLLDKDIHHKFAHYAPEEFDKLIAKNSIP